MNKPFYIFKIMLSLLAIFIFAEMNAQEKTYTFDTQSTKEGFEVLRSDLQRFGFSYEIPSLTISDFSENDFSGQILQTYGVHLPSQAGAPNLPSISRFVAIPNGASARLEIIEVKKQVIKNVDLLPAPAIPLGDDDRPLQYTKDETIYAKNGFFPAQPFQLSKTTSLRGIDVIIMGITPFQYNPVTKELIVFYDIQAEVVFEGGNGQFGDDRLRSIWWESILKDNIFNSNVLPVIDFAEKAKNKAQSREEGAEYLIIIPNGPAFAQWADSIKVFRQRQGITTKVVNLTEVGGNTVNAIETYVNNAYNTWTTPPAAILLLGDYSTNANDGIISHTLNDHPGGYNPYISDNPFADVTGNKLPDIVFARITARDAAELQHMVGKFLNYERTPPTNQSFYSNPITAMGWQTERWFQLCSETINGFWEHALGKTPVRQNAIYSGSPGGAWSSNSNTTTVVNYFGPNGLNYIPANTAHLTDWGGNATRMNNSINSGAFMVQHRDHGLETGWGEPDYRNNHLSGLTNQDLTFVWSINCLTGKFNYSSESFTERFHRHDHGALGLIAATEVSYSFVNDVFVWGAYDNMWPQFMPDYGSTPAERGILPAFANAAGKYFLQQSNWPYNPQHKEITHQLFHHHGDAFMTVYSEMPQDLAVNHMPVLLSGMEVFEVTANEGAMIALSVNNEIIGASIATNGVTQVLIVSQEPGNQIIVTVTMQNYYRYEQVIECIPPSGPYMIYNAYSIDDAAGNGNGLVDYGESIVLDMAMKNVGSEIAENVVVNVTTASPFVTLNTSSFELGNVEPGTIALAQDALSFIVSDEVPNNHSIAFALTITSGTNEWTGQFNVPAYAPSFIVGSYSIADPAGNNNGRLDPGETVEISFTATNNGNSDAYGVTASFLNNSPYLTVIQESFTIGQWMAGSQETVTYTVEVSNGAPIGSIASFGFTVASGAYIGSQYFDAKIGLIIEDFETGDFSQYDWTNGGNQPWQIVTAAPYSGNFAAKSGLISHNQSSQLITQYEVGSNDTISFYYKVSSESNYDFLRFYIDNTKVGEWSGTVAWTKASYPVASGMRTFKWEYMKDVSVSSGEDCGWIDDVVFPPMATTTAWAGADMYVCFENTAQLNGTATNFTSIEWTSSGTGSFSDPAIINPVYTPSANDYASGSIVLTLTAHGTAVVTDQLNVTFNPAVIAFAGEGATICPEGQFELTGAEAYNFTSLVWTTSGDGQFSHANLLKPTYVPGPNDRANQMALLQLEASGLAGCMSVNSEVTLSLYPEVAIEMLPSAAVCAFETVDLLQFAEATNAIAIEWSSTGDGAFTSTSELESTYTPGDQDVSEGSVMISLTAYGEGDCEPKTAEMTIYIHSLPTVAFSENMDICIGTEVSVEMHLTGQSPWEVMLNDPFQSQLIETSPFVMQLSPEQTTQINAITVTDANCSASSEAEIWINVFEIPMQALKLIGPDTVDFNNGFQTVFTLEEVPFAEQYTFIVSPAEAGSVSLADINAIVDWNPDFRGEVSIQVYASNFCGQGEPSESKTVEVMSTIGINELIFNDLKLFPNPTDAVVTLESRFSFEGQITLNIIDLMGKVVKSEFISPGKGGFSHSVSLDHLPKGVYFLNLEAETIRLTRKLIIK